MSNAEQDAMPKQAKSLSKGKFKPSRAAVAKTVRAKGKRMKGKRSGRDPLDSFVDMAAHALDLKLENVVIGEFVCPQTETVSNKFEFPPGSPSLVDLACHRR